MGDYFYTHPPNLTWNELSLSEKSKLLNKFVFVGIVGNIF